MDFQLTEEQTMLVDAAAKLLATPANPAHWRDLPDAAVARERWRQLGELGLFMLALPGAEDGIGSIVEIALMHEAAGDRLAFEPLIAAGLAGRDLLAICDGAEVRALLDGLLAGERIPAAAFGGPDGLRAVRDGDRWRIEGEDPLVVGLGIADDLLAVARDADGGDLHILRVDPAGAGLRIEADRLIDGSWGGRVLFEGAAGEPLGRCSPAQVVQILARVRLAACAEMLGVMGSAVRFTADYLKTRAQFGQPLAEQQALRHHLAEMVVMAEQARAYLHVGLDALENGEGDVADEIAAIRRAVGELAMSSGERAIQLHGGMGMTEEHAIGHHLKRALVLAAIYPP